MSEEKHSCLFPPSLGEKMIIIENKTLEELGNILMFLEFLECEESILIKVSGNPHLESYCENLKRMRKIKNAHFTIDGQKFNGTVVPYYNIIHKEKRIKEVLPTYGFYYWIEEELLVFDYDFGIMKNPKEAGVKRALKFIRYLKARNKDVDS